MRAGPSAGARDRDRSGRTQLPTQVSAVPYPVVNAITEVNTADADQEAEECADLDGRRGTTPYQRLITRERHAAAEH